MRAVDLIRRKRDSGELTREEIEQFIAAYTAGDIPDYQMSAWLMAVVLRGMTRAGNCRADRGHAAFGQRPRLLRSRGPQSGQAFHRGRGRQDFAGHCTDCRGRRAEGAHDQRARPGTQRRHARQARIHSRLQRQSLLGGISARAGHLRVRPDRADGGNRSRRQENLCACATSPARWKAPL